MNSYAAAGLGVVFIALLLFIRYKWRCAKSISALNCPPCEHTQLVHRLCPHNNVVQSYEVQQKDSLDEHLDVLTRKLAEKEGRLRLSKSKIRETQHEIENLHAIDQDVRVKYRDIMDSLRGDLLQNERECKRLQEQIEWVSRRRAELKEEASGGPKAEPLGEPLLMTPFRIPAAKKTGNCAINKSEDKYDKKSVCTQMSASLKPIKIQDSKTTDTLQSAERSKSTKIQDNVEYVEDIPQFIEGPETMKTKDSAKADAPQSIVKSKATKIQDSEKANTAPCTEGSTKIQDSTKADSSLCTDGAKTAKMHDPKKENPSHSIKIKDSDDETVNIIKSVEEEHDAVKRLIESKLEPSKTSINSNVSADVSSEIDTLDKDRINKDPTKKNYRHRQSKKIKENYNCSSSDNDTVQSKLPLILQKPN